MSKSFVIVVTLSLSLTASFCAREKVAVKNYNPQPSSIRYFPVGALGPESQFREAWYSDQLSSLQEPPLLRSSNESAPTVFRFLWLRTFHPPVSVRVVVRGEEAEVVSKVCDGAGGYEPGELIVNRTSVSKGAELDRFLGVVDVDEFWEADSYEPVHKKDGAAWIIECNKNGRYHVVARQSPKSGPTREMGLAFLNLTDLGEDRIY